MDNILPFPTDYLPSFEEHQRLEGIQTMLTQWRAELSREHKLKSLNAGQIWLSKQRFHNGIRDTWKIYQGLAKEMAKYKKVQ